MLPVLSLLAVLCVCDVPAPAPQLRVTTDSTRREILIEYRVGEQSDAGAAEKHEHGAHTSGGHASHVQRMVRFASPLTGWLRGARVELEDPAGVPLPLRSIHHINLMNLSRRQLVHGGIERMWASGQETDPVTLPAGVGMPVATGMMFGLMVAYDPDALPAGSRVTLRISWTPSTTTPRPVDVFPLPLDVNYRVGESAAYDLPAGRSSRSFEFVMPISGRMLGVGGHMHDYGESLQLVDVETGRVLFHLTARKDSAGLIQSVTREVFGVSGRGRKLEEGRRYRLTAVYDNPTGRTIPLGGMGEVGVGFTPDDLADWPVLDHSEPDVAADIANLGSFEEG